MEFNYRGLYHLCADYWEHICTFIDYRYSVKYTCKEFYRRALMQYCKHKWPTTDIHFLVDATKMILKDLPPKMMRMSIRNSLKHTTKPHKFIAMSHLANIQDITTGLTYGRVDPEAKYKVISNVVYKLCADETSIDALRHMVKMLTSKRDIELLCRILYGKFYDIREKLSEGIVNPKKILTREFIKRSLLEDHNNFYKFNDGYWTASTQKLFYDILRGHPEIRKVLFEKYHAGLIEGSRKYDFYKDHTVEFLREFIRYSKDHDKKYFPECSARRLVNVLDAYRANYFEAFSNLYVAADTEEKCLKKYHEALDDLLEIIRVHMIRSYN